jgi:hypothetical protein
MALPPGDAPTPGSASHSARQDAAEALRLELLTTAEASDGRAAWHVATGLAAALVHTSPAGPRPVDPEELVSWGLAREEAFHLASANVRGGALPTVTTHAPTGGAELVFITGPGSDVSSHALWLDDLIGRLPAAGALVAVPHRRAVLAHRLERHDHAVEAVNLLLLMADGAHRQGPDPVSADLYWWREGWLTSLGGRVDGDVVHVEPPSELVEVLESLPRL